MSLPKNRVLNPILQVLVTNPSGVAEKRYVTRITEKLIVVANNECSESYFLRKSGVSYPFSKGVSKIEYNSLKMLEKHASQFGIPSTKVFKEKGEEVIHNVNVYDTGWRSAVNSKGDVVRNVPKLDKSMSMMSWFRLQGFSCIRCYPSEQIGSYFK